jgi:hypothetical protein
MSESTTDSASEPPSSAVSFSTDGYMTTPSSATSHSQRSSVSLDFGCFPATYGNGSSNYFKFDASAWHPPMNLSGNTSPMMTATNPAMASMEDESPMDYLHPPMVDNSYAKVMGNINDQQVADEMYFSYVHPPMSLSPEEPTNAFAQDNHNVQYGPHLEYEYMRF